MSYQEKLAKVTQLAETWLNWAGQPTQEARGCGNVDDERNEASNDAYRDTATRLLAILGQACCGHASDCAIHNAPAEAAGPCDCGKNASQYRALDAGLRAHYFLRMTSKDRFGDLDRFECACGCEFADSEQMREHQNLYLRIFLGIAEEVGNRP